jgi:hypothetical protein
MPGRSVSSACLVRQVSSGLSRNCKNERRPNLEEAWFVAMNFMARQLDGHDRYCELVSDPEPIPRVLEIGIHTAISRRSVSVITHTMRSTRF